MEESLEATVREAYIAFGRGDIEGYLGACTPEFEFCVPGRSALAGSYIGREGLFELARKAIQLTDGTFHEEVEDVLANDRHAVILARHLFKRDGDLKDYRTAHVYEISEGKLARCFEQPRDPSVFDAAWGGNAEPLATLHA